MNKNILILLIVVLLGGGAYYVQKAGIVSLGGENSAGIVSSLGLPAGTESTTLIQDIQDRSMAISSMLSRVQAIRMNTEFLDSEAFRALLPLNAVILLPTDLGRDNPFLEIPGVATKKATN